MLERAVTGCLIGLALLAGPALPEAFLRLPSDVREKATVVVSGVYTVAKGPDEQMPNGGMRWPLLRGFTCKTVYRGRVVAEYVGVDLAESGDSWGKVPLVEGREYLLVLRPSRDSRRILAVRKRNWNWREVVAQSEVLAILPL